MKSRTSCFNPAFSRHLLRRFWPLWALWLAVLILAGIGAPAGNPPEAYGSQDLYVQELNRVLLHTGVFLAEAAAAAGPLMTMAMLGWLYHPGSCGMVCSLPMRREEAYLSSVLTGLVPMIAAEVLVFLLILARFGGIEGVDRSHIVTWLTVVVMGSVGFYGFACFCGVLTGNTVVLPLVYVLLGCAAVVLESTVRALLGVLVYGYTWERLSFDWLAPLPRVLSSLNVVGEQIPPAPPVGSAIQAERNMVYHVEGLPYLAGFCAAGIVLALLAVPILRKRHMETAGEIVAVPVLRPIFRLCMAVGTALVLATVGCDELFGQIFTGRTLFPAAVVLLCLGAAIGYFIAEMLIRKTLRVFGRGWKLIGIICASLTLLAVLAETDVTGYEKRVPAPDEVMAVYMPYYSGDRLTDPASVRAYCDLHAGIVAHKAANDGAFPARSTTLTLRYVLKNGETFTRVYRVANDAAAQADPDSDIARYQALCNIPEAILGRVRADREVRAETILYAALEILTPNQAPDRKWDSETLRLSAETAESLYREGILPDAREGNIALWYAWDSDESRGESTAVSIDIELAPDPAKAPAGEYRAYDPRDHLSVTVLTRSEHTLRWLKDNLGMEARSREEP